LGKVIIKGGQPLSGTVKIKGSKNSCLPIMAASLLTSKEIILEEVPDLEDVRTMSHLLASLGVQVEQDRRRERIYLCAHSINTTTAPYGPVRLMRASFLIMGPLLARMGAAEIPLPGGCAIGTRPIDLHIKGFSSLGASAEMRGGCISTAAQSLSGTTLYLDFPSVGATENLLMAAVLVKGRTTIENAAAEPEVVDLANFLSFLGAKIKGAGTSLIEIEGVSSLGGGHYHVIPDRIEAGTFMAAAAITGGDITLENVMPRHLTAVTAKLKEMGILVEEKTPWSLRVAAPGRPNAVEIKTLPYPGFPTDLQPQFMALLCLAAGTSIITETVFEKRMLHAEELMRMGGDIRIEERNAIINGRKRLYPASVQAGDLRGGAALLLAALAAEGVSQLEGYKHIRRGYSKLLPRLRSLGARIYGAKQRLPR